MSACQLRTRGGGSFNGGGLLADALAVLLGRSALKAPVDLRLEAYTGRSDAPFQD